MSLEEVLSKIESFSTELGLDLTKPADRFKWFLASILFAKRISADIAKKTYREFEREGLTTPEKILEAGWDRIVQVLDSGGYVRYDFSTASNILECMKKLVEEYGDLEKVHEKARDTHDLEVKLQEFKGVGPVAVNIFLRELRGTWRKADPKVSDIAVKVAKKIGLSDPKPYESALVRISLEYCKRKRCIKCPISIFCKKRVT
ncbi:hypothetical protein J7L06_06865 [Candidatus Bathyarchaeota archaeon]|nr:hypothetical protein [Candidatus Bathyarchaeota archaeon]